MNVLPDLEVAVPMYWNMGWVEARLRSLPAYLDSLQLFFRMPSKDQALKAFSNLMLQSQDDEIAFD